MDELLFKELVSFVLSGDNANNFLPSSLLVGDIKDNVLGVVVTSTLDVEQSECLTLEFNCSKNLFAVFFSLNNKVNRYVSIVSVSKNLFDGSRDLYGTFVIVQQVVLKDEVRFVLRVSNDLFHWTVSESDNDLPSLVSVL
jgi:hypothetical protein